MENQTAQILENALQPPPPARALIAEKPVESRDAGEDFTMSAEWREEIRRRAASIGQGEAELIDGDEAFRKASEAMG